MSNQPPVHSSAHEKPRFARILGVPMDLGQSRRGVDMGPSAVRYAGLQERLRGLGYEVSDCGNVPVPVVEQIAEHERPEEERNARHLRSIVQVCQSIYNQIIQCTSNDEFAIVLGGDHSMSVGSVAGISSRSRPGVIWVDAHADYNTPDISPSGNVHGMPMAALLGNGPQALIDVGFPGAKLEPEQVVMIGIRNLDDHERQKLVSSGITVFTMTDIDEYGLAWVARRTIAHFADMDCIHVSLDMDSLDPDYAPGVGTPVPGGLTYREAHLLMEILSQSGKVQSMDIVEINPILDERNRTAELAVELAVSLLGKRII
jgi:arginase